MPILITAKIIDVYKNTLERNFFTIQNLDANYGEILSMISENYIIPIIFHCGSEIQTLLMIFFLNCF